ncbi:hypothetical protein GCM10029978_077150 [Actinoallomurus acanthiterrae]
MSAPGRRVLVAGIGNVFLGDDGFGVEVVGRIDASALPSTVEVTDYGIRGVHLVYELLDGRVDTLILVDAVPLDGPPGTLAVLEVDPPTCPAPSDPPTGRASSDLPTGLASSDPPIGPVSSDPPTAPTSAPEPPSPPALDGHGMNPEAVLGLLRAIGGDVDRVLVVGCRGRHRGADGTVRAGARRRGRRGLARDGAGVRRSGEARKGGEATGRCMRWDCATRSSTRP